jgi:hypothetical protein
MDAPAAVHRLHRAHIHSPRIHPHIIRHTSAHDSGRQGVVLLRMLSVHEYPGDNLWARPARTAPRASPPSARCRRPLLLFQQLDFVLGALVPYTHHKRRSLHSPSCRRRPSISGARRNSRVRPVYAHSSPRTGTSTGYDGAAGVYMDLDEVSFFGSSCTFLLHLRWS